jgi:hypothetical protein
METTFGKIIETKKIMPSSQQEVLTKSQLSLFNNKNRMTNSLIINDSTTPPVNIYNSLRIKTSTPMSQSIFIERNGGYKTIRNSKLNLNGYLSDSECNNNNNNNSSYNKYKLNQE